MYLFYFRRRRIGFLGFLPESQEENQRNPVNPVKKKTNPVKFQIPTRISGTPET